MSLKVPEKKKLSAVSLKLLEGSAQGEAPPGSQP